MRSFWFGDNLPSEYADPIVREKLSFNGQLHLRCRSCQAIMWVDDSLDKNLLLESLKDGYPCPRCDGHDLEVVKFAATESRVCKRCGEQSFSKPGDAFQCGLCRSQEFVVEKRIVDPPYPRVLFALYGRDQPFGESPAADIEFLVEYVRHLRMLPEFHKYCIHLVAFFESLVEHVYGTSRTDAHDLLNAASDLMRVVYRETGNLDAAYLAIAIMIDAYHLSSDATQRAVYGFNIAQNINSVFARGDQGWVSMRLGLDLKSFGVSLSRRTLTALEELGGERLGAVRALQKWRLGDLLAALEPSEEEIDESLLWFEAALNDPALPSDDADHVRQSAVRTQSKRRNLPESTRQVLRKHSVDYAARYYVESEGIERLIALLDMLVDSFKHDDLDRRQELARLGLGEAIAYTARNDPRHLLRFSGNLLSRLVAGFAAERFVAGEFLQGVAGVESFRSFAIERGYIPNQTRASLQFELLTAKIFSESDPDPRNIADRMISQHEQKLQNDIKTILNQAEQRCILWLEFWGRKTLVTTVNKLGGEIVIKSEIRNWELTDPEIALNLPNAAAPPGRLRARLLQNALEAGCDLFGAPLDAIPKEEVVVFIGSSLTSTWPIDTFESLRSDDSDRLRPVIYAPSIGTAISTSTAQEREISKVLVITYGGEDLVSISKEVSDIRSVYGSRVTILEGNVATKNRLLEELAKKYNVVHFCGHGEFDYLEPMKSSMIFDGRRGVDGQISAEDILKIGSIGDRPIVVMSACTSALVLPNGSNNFLGLAGALIRTGARAIAGARWPVSDVAAAAFSKHFHEHLAVGSSTSVSVAFAKSRLKQEHRLDEWSAFISICN